MKLKTKSGQILVITLLVLTIVAIIVVSLVGLVNRDVQQVASTEQYENAYNTSETQLKKVLNEYAKPNSNLSGIVDTFDGGGDEGIYCAPDITNKIYNCTVTSDEFSNVDLTTTIVVEDTNQVKDFPIYKDRTFDMGLNGYVGTIQFWWDKYAAIEFILTYKESSGTIQSVRDVYDPNASIYNSLAAQGEPSGMPQSPRTFPFADITGRDRATSVAINLSNIVSTQGASINGATTISLQIIPRMHDRFDSILLNANATTSGLPDQIREFTSSSYNQSGGSSTPVASIQTKVPLAPQPDSILNYSVITNGMLRNGQ